VGPRAAYEWQYATDPETWTSAPSMLQAKTDILGLTVNVTHCFHVRAVVKAGEGDWSQVVSLRIQSAVSSGESVRMTAAAVGRASDDVSPTVAVVGGGFLGCGGDERRRRRSSPRRFSDRPVRREELSTTWELRYTASPRSGRTSGRGFDIVGARAQDVRASLEDVSGSDPRVGASVLRVGASTHSVGG
jgi:hypothetical protein